MSFQCNELAYYENLLFQVISFIYVSVIPFIDIKVISIIDFSVIPFIDVKFNFIYWWQGNYMY